MKTPYLSQLTGITKQNYIYFIEKIKNFIQCVPGFPWGIAFLIVLVLNFVLNIILLRPGGGYVYDDREAILNNMDLVTQNSHGWRNMWFNDFWGTPMSSSYSHKSYRPITVITYKVQLFLGLPSNTDQENDNPFYFKLVNCLIHTMNCFLVLVMFDLISKKFQLHLNYSMDNFTHYKFVSFHTMMATTLFAIHPIHTEAVASIVGRAELLATTFGLSSILIYNTILHSKNHPELLNQSCQHRFNITCYWLLYISLALLASFSKEQAISYIALAIVYDYLITQSQPIKKNYSLTGRTFLLIILIILVTYVRLTIAGWQFPNFKVYDNPSIFLDCGIFMRSLNFFYHALLAYWILIYSGSSSYDWSAGCVAPILTLFDYRALLCLLTFTLSMYITINYKWMTKNSPPISNAILFSLAFTLIPFLPASNLFYHVGFVVAERTLYTPSIGFCWLITLAFTRVTSVLSLKWPQKVGLRLLVKFTVALLYLSLAISTVVRNRDWHTQLSLYNSALKVCPNSAKVIYNVATLLSARGYEDGAELLYLRAISAFPSYPLPYNNLAIINLSRGNATKALELLNMALSFEPDLAIAWLNKGITLSDQAHKISAQLEAEACFERALAISPDYAMAHFAAATFYIKHERLEEGKTHLERCLSLKPRFCSAWKNMLKLLIDMGELSQVKARVGEAIRACPLDANVVALAALTFATLGDYPTAEKTYLSAIQIIESKPKIGFNGKTDLGELYGNMGVLYHKMGQIKRAKMFYSHSLNLNPNSAIMKDNLKKLARTKDPALSARS